MDNNSNNRPIPVKRGGENKKVVAVNTRKNRGASTVAIITLSVLLGLSLILGLTAAFFTANQTATGTITLGDPVNINITQGGTSVETQCLEQNIHKQLVFLFQQTQANVF